MKVRDALEFLLVGLAAVSAAWIAQADDDVRGLLGADVQTNITITSGTVEIPAWKRRVVTQIDGEIKNDAGTIGDAAVSAATGEMAEGAQEIADAADEAMRESLATLDEAKGSAATNAISFALAIAPETTRSNLTAFVVKEDTIDGGATDRQWVWFSHDLAMKPVRYVVYSTFDRAVTNQAEWVNWTNKVTVTENGRTWTGCHVCTVSRPAWARGVNCLTKPNDRLGGPGGFDFGDMVLTSGGRPYLTQYVTNSITGEVIYFDNGAIKGYWRNGDE